MPSAIATSMVPSGSRWVHTGQHVLVLRRLSEGLQESSLRWKAKRAATFISLSAGGSCRCRRRWSGTPGTDFFRFRKILSEHANRFINEHNVLQLRYADPDQSRIYKVVEELTPEQRIKAANTDQWTRGHIGWLWRLIESFRLMQSDAVPEWQARRAEIDELPWPCSVPFAKAAAWRIGPSAITPMSIGRGGKRGPALLGGPHLRAERCRSRHRDGRHASHRPRELPQRARLRARASRTMIISSPCSRLIRL